MGRGGGYIESKPCTFIYGFIYLRLQTVFCTDKPENVAGRRSERSLPALAQISLHITRILSDTAAQQDVGL